MAKSTSLDPVNAVHMRSQTWAKNRDIRLQRERLEREKQFKSQHSFKPKLENNSFLSTSGKAKCLS